VASNSQCRALKELSHVSKPALQIQANEAMTAFWNSWWAISFMLAPFVIGLSGMAVLAYTTHRYYDRVLSAFPNSRGVQNFTRMWAGFGFSSRFLQVSSTAGFVLWPKTHIRRGDLDPNEVHNFPAEIKKLMVIATILMATGGVWLFLSVALLKLTES
jgi:hypothetical protein